MPSPYYDTEQSYTDDDLMEAMSEYVQSCIRTSHTDHDENVRVFISENVHIVGLTREDTERMYDEIMADIDAVSRSASAMSRRRWAKTTPEERTAIAKRAASFPRPNRKKKKPQK